MLTNKQANADTKGAKGPVSFVKNKKVVTFKNELNASYQNLKTNKLYDFTNYHHHFLNFNLFLMKTLKSKTSNLTIRLDNGSVLLEAMGRVSSCHPVGDSPLKVRRNFDDDIRQIGNKFINTSVAQEEETGLCAAFCRCGRH